MHTASRAAAGRAAEALRPLCSHPQGRMTTVARASAQPSVLITGGNTGIGLETAKALCRKQYAVTIACRDMNKATQALDTIRSACPSAAVDALQLDLADLSNVRDAANSLLDSGRSYDVLINNAGVMACPKMQTKDGYEYQLGVNHLGHFLLTTMLLPQMKSSGRPARIVNVASSAHLFGKINFNDLMSDTNYQPWPVYGQSKLANIMFTYELARRLKPSDNVTVNCLHPGIVQTELFRYQMSDPSSWWVAPVSAVARLLFLKTPEQGAATSIMLASSPDMANVTGKYFEDCKPVSSSKASYDVHVAKRLWEVSEELVAKAVRTAVTPAQVLV